MARPMRAPAPVTSAVLTVLVFMNRFGVGVSCWAVSYIGLRPFQETRRGSGLMRAVESKRGTDDKLYAGRLVRVAVLLAADEAPQGAENLRMTPLPTDENPFGGIGLAQ